MSNASPTNKKIVETLDEQHRRTIEVIETVKRISERNLDVTTQLAMQLDADPTQPLQETERKEDAQLEAAEAELKEEAAEEVEDLTLSKAALAGMSQQEVYEEIRKASVRDVMGQINPVLTALQKFIDANAIGKAGQPQPAPADDQLDDNAFAEKLIEEMKTSLSQRQRIALARKRLTSP
jgi:queuine/archaeosine tRNA-ribosyltransferase